MVASVLGSLKLVSAVRSNNFDTVLVRRQKCIAKLNEQIEIIKSEIQGVRYEVKRTWRERDEMSGEMVTINRNKKLRKLWFVNADSGKICFQLTYSGSVIDFAKGKNSIEVANLSELLDTVQLVSKAVEVGELDSQLSMASDTVRGRLKRKK